MNDKILYYIAAGGFAFSGLSFFIKGDNYILAFSLIAACISFFVLASTSSKKDKKDKEKYGNKLAIAKFDNEFPEYAEYSTDFKESAIRILDGTKDLPKETQIQSVHQLAEEHKRLGFK